MRGGSSLPPHPAKHPTSAAAADMSAAARLTAGILTSVGIVPVVRIGVLTGGGDCPGLNAVIRAVVRRGIDDHGHAIVGFRDGWKGPLEDLTVDLTIESVRGILPRGGTILRSSR